MPYKKKKSSKRSNSTRSNSTRSNSTRSNSARSNSTRSNSTRSIKSKKNNIRNKCNHWFRLNNIEKVDCLLQDAPESDTTLKQLIGSATGYRRRIVERFLADDYALDYFVKKSKKEIILLLGFFMVLQGGEYGPSYGMPSQKWLSVCIDAKRNN